MLLGAVTLVIGFLILSSLLVRVGQIPEEAARDETTLLEEMEAVRIGVNQHVLGLGHTTVQLNDALDHMERLEGARGFVFTWTCPGGTPDPLTVTLSDGTGRVTLSFIEPAC